MGGCEESKPEEFSSQEKKLISLFFLFIVSVGGNGC